MNKRPGFTADVDNVKEDVNQEVNTILSLAKERTFQRGAPASSPSPTAADGDHSATRITPRPARITTPRRNSRPQEQRSRKSLVNVTTRLPRETKELLEEAALRQQLAKSAPESEQAIIDDALQQWFKRHGYRLKEDAAPDDESSDAVTDQ